MKNLFLAAAAVAGIAGQADAATFDYQGITWVSEDTVLNATVGEPTRGYYFFDPCGYTQGWAEVCVVEAFPYDTPYPFYGTFNWVSYAEVGSPTGWGTYVLIAFDYIAETAGVTDGLSFEGEIWAGAYEDDGMGGQYWNSNYYPAGGYIPVEVASAIPLPATGVLAAAGLGFLTLLRRRKSGAV